MQKRYHKAKIESLKRKLYNALESLSNETTPHQDFDLLLDVYKYIDTITLEDLENK